MHQWLESPDVDGAPAVDATLHWGVRLQRTNGWPRTLIVAFCVQVHEDGELHVGGLIWNGPDGVDLNPAVVERQTARAGSLLVCKNIEAVVFSVSDKLPGILDDFAGHT